MREGTTVELWSSGGGVGIGFGDWDLGSLGAATALVRRDAGREDRPATHEHTRGSANSPLLSVGITFLVIVTHESKRKRGVQNRIKHHFKQIISCANQKKFCANQAVVLLKQTAILRK